MSIGLEFGGVIGHCGSFGMYIPVLKVRGLADSRIGGGLNEPMAGTDPDTGTTTTDETVESTAQPRFAQVFAPGLFGVLGLGRSPFALAFGAQVAPSLRSTTSTFAPTRNVSVLQVGAYLVIDTPVWIFR